MTDTEHARIELRADTSANWTAANPVLAAGEPGWDISLAKLKIGDGVTPWATLPYLTAGGGGGGTGTAGKVTRIKYTGGDFTVTAGVSTAYGTPAAANAALLDISVPAVAGDTVLLGFDIQLATAGVTLRTDVFTVTSGGALGTSVSGVTNTNGIPGWLALASNVRAGGVYPYVVQAGDLNAGVVKFRPTGKADGGSRLCAANVNSPLTFWAQNTGQ